ncbi:hypothetical protein [Streptomyces solicathayae]|uniref:Uncharacterized protein n=1 Tax=Streptomyces solicathayae TaxID=3081768 RepID=A0ABZ0LKN3_9ACTN|nr:hypothetical protein [Streptomyces sp. HUAS YS2]WOX20036.1 hypothetical protein R2D22_00960 [Streptomyces sp. HUAS YS2]
MSEAVPRLRLRRAPHRAAPGPARYCGLFQGFAKLRRRNRERPARDATDAHAPVVEPGAGR